MTETLDVTLPVARTCPFDPPAEYGRLREEHPIVKVPIVTGMTTWLVTRHEDARAALTDRRLSSDRRKPGFPLFVPGPNPFLRQKPSMIGMDGAEHSAARRAVIGEFTVKRLAALRPRIQEIVDGCVDEILRSGRPVDLVAALSLPVPSLVICELLGVPYADHDYFQARTMALVNRATAAEDRMRAFDELRGYLDTLVSTKEAEPGDDLLGRQILAQRADGEVDHEGLVSLASLLLIAGHETTANMISLGTTALLENPDQLAVVRDDPERTPPAVEELLRYFSIVDFATARTATEDLELGGVTIRAGEGVLVSGVAANRDATAFDDPDALDVERGARHHVAFGFGPHQCLGQNLARMELQIVFDTLFRRIPGLRLAAPVEDLSFKNNATIYGLYELPVTW